MRIRDSACRRCTEWRIFLYSRSILPDAYASSTFGLAIQPSTTMKNLSQCALALTLAFGFSIAHAQMASAPAPMSKSEPRPAGTTPPNTAPYSPGQADTSTTRKITSAQRKEARGTRDTAIKACSSETDAKAKKQCVKAAKETYHRAVTP